MKKNILALEGVTQLTKTAQKFFNGGQGTPIGDCYSDDDCPSGSSCQGELCITDCPNNPNPPGGCSEPIRDCQWPETGCGCRY